MPNVKYNYIFKCAVCYKETGGRSNQRFCGEHSRLGERLKLHNTSILEMTDRLLAQDFMCAACGVVEIDVKSCQIDHNHNCCPGTRSCGKCIRGLLCKPCNTTFHGVYEDPDVHIRRAAYLLETNN